MIAASPTRLRRAKNITLQVGVALTGALVCALAFVKLIDVGSVADRLKHLNVPLAFACGGIFLGAYVVRALRWRWFLSPYRVSVPKAIAIYQVAIFVNWLLPVRGGELVKCLLLRRLNGIPISRSLPSVTMDKFMDLLPAVFLVALLPFVPMHLGRPLWFLLVFVLCIVCFGVAVLALAVWRRSSAMALISLTTRWLPGRARRKVEPFVARFVDALLSLVTQPRLMLTAGAYTLVAVLLDATFCLLAFQVVGASLSFPVVLFGYTFFNLAYVLPTPPGQIGSNELIGLLVFSGMLGINRSAVAAMFLFSHPWTALLMVVSGVVSLSAMGVSLRNALGLGRPADAAVVEPVVAEPAFVAQPEYATS
jgi:uncharacterized protein (TIRG00374 family)